MTSEFRNALESADAKKVDAAMDALAAGNFAEVESLLRAVIANTPSNYTNVIKNADGLSIKFWDQADFLHYITWQKSRGLANQSINWISNAYPRAHYCMGFACVKAKQYDRAIEFLDKGLLLEPTNPKFLLEKAQALIQSGRKEEALAIYDQIGEVGPYLSARLLAVSLRGRGFVLIELGDLQRAEDAFKSSLKIEPDSKVALNELLYIEELRQGGAATHTETVPWTAPDGRCCAVCGNQFDKGIVISHNGMPLSICDRCKNKLTKKWWQFWK
ncbi:MAG: tetratricopeptide repeat protein [Verrucomicrobia bacterium]|jgi:tetratricopeptide (TPR) repeat protein|nr:tetratricopeptide repeat protein [Verrucomicrobiota bacterium]